MAEGPVIAHSPKRKLPGIVKQETHGIQQMFWICHAKERLLRRPKGGARGRETFPDDRRVRQADIWRIALELLEQWGLFLYKSWRRREDDHFEELRLDDRSGTAEARELHSAF